MKRKRERRGEISMSEIQCSSSVSSSKEAVEELAECGKMEETWLEENGHEKIKKANRDDSELELEPRKLSRQERRKWLAECSWEQSDGLKDRLYSLVFALLSVLKQDGPVSTAIFWDFDRGDATDDGSAVQILIKDIQIGHDMNPTFIIERGDLTLFEMRATDFVSGSDLMFDFLSATESFCIPAECQLQKVIKRAKEGKRHDSTLNDVSIYRTAKMFFEEALVDIKNDPELSGNDIILKACLWVLEGPLNTECDSDGQVSFSSTLKFPILGSNLMLKSKLPCLLPDSSVFVASCSSKTKLIQAQDKVVGQQIVAVGGREIPMAQYFAECNFWFRVISLLFESALGLVPRFGQIVSICELCLLGNDSFVSLPRRSGKSLIFLFSAVMMKKISVYVTYSRATTVKIEKYCKRYGIRCISVTDNNTHIVKTLFEQDEADECTILLTPHRNFLGLREYLTNPMFAGRISMIGVAEAHLMGTLQFQSGLEDLGRWQVANPSLVVVSFSATANFNSQNKTMELLKGPERTFSRIIGLPSNENIRFCFRPLPSNEKMYSEVAGLFLQGVRTGVITFRTVSSCESFRKGFSAFVSNHYPVINLPCLLYVHTMSAVELDALERTLVSARNGFVDYQVQASKGLVYQAASSFVWCFQVKSSDISITWIQSGDRVSVGEKPGTVVSVVLSTLEVLVEFEMSEHESIEKVNSFSILRVSFSRKNRGCLLVTTSDLATGIDSADLDLVVCGDLPPSINELLQIAQRAGSNGRKSMCLTYFSMNAYLDQQRAIDKATVKSSDPTGSIEEAIQKLTDLAKLFTNVTGCVAQLINTYLFKRPLKRCNPSWQCENCALRAVRAQPISDIIIRDTFDAQPEIRRAIFRLLQRKEAFTKELLLKALVPRMKLSLTLVGEMIDLWIFHGCINLDGLKSNSTTEGILCLKVQNVNEWPLLQPGYDTFSEVLGWS